MTEPVGRRGVEMPLGWVPPVAAESLRARPARCARGFDPSDDVARRQLVEKRVWYLEYTLPELPAGVLYGTDGATVEQCSELLELLQDVKQHVARLGCEARYAELFSECDFHYHAYADDLRGAPLSGGYAAYLDDRDRRSEPARVA